MIFIFNVTILTLLQYMADVNLKTYARMNNYTSLFLACLCYIGVMAMFVYSVKYSNILYTRTLENGISTILSSVLAYYLLKESMTNMYQWSGLGFVILGVAMLNFGKIPH
jgi:multidrug transporter EmrE-like cation transporter